MACWSALRTLAAAAVTQAAHLISQARMSDDKEDTSTGGAKYDAIMLHILGWSIGWKYRYKQQKSSQIMDR